MSRFQYDIPWQKCSKCGCQAILEEYVVIEPKRTISMRLIDIFEKLFNQQVDKIVTCKSCSIEINRNDKIDSLLY